MADKLNPQKLVDEFFGPTGSFGLADLPAVAKVVQLATDYVASQEAEVK